VNHDLVASRDLRAAKHGPLKLSFDCR
jgi:hypothetical protein